MKKPILILIISLIVFTLPSCSTTSTDNTGSTIETYANLDFLEGFVDMSEPDLYKRYNQLAEVVDDSEYYKISDLIVYLNDNNLLSTYSKDYGILAAYILECYSDLRPKSESTTTLKEFSIVWNNENIFPVDPNARMEDLGDIIKKWKDSDGEEVNINTIAAYRVKDISLRYYLVTQYLQYLKESGTINGNFETLDTFSKAFIQYSNYSSTVVENNLVLTGTLPEDFVVYTEEETEANNPNSLF